MDAPVLDHLHSAKILRIVDGDTYDVEVDMDFRSFTRLPLRLAHVDAPEHNTAAGKAVITYLTGLFGALPISVIVHTYKPIDKYGRYLADVYLPTNDGWINLSERLIEMGFAKPYEGGKKE